MLNTGHTVAIKHSAWKGGNSVAVCGDGGSGGRGGGGRPQRGNERATEEETIFDRINDGDFTAVPPMPFCLSVLLSLRRPEVTLCGWQDVRIQLHTPTHTL